MGDIINHFRRHEMVDKGSDGRAWSTRDRYASYIDSRIEPRWGKERLDSIVAGDVEEWLRDLTKKDRRSGEENQRSVAQGVENEPLSSGTKAKIRDIMSILFNHAIRWDIYPNNPISGPARKAGVRQSSKRKGVPDILELGEMQAILAHLGIRERALVSVDMITGIRRSELAGLKWADIDFENLVIHVRRSLVDQRTGDCKNEASKKPIPFDEDTAQDLLAWYRFTPYRKPEDWVFASDSARAGKKRGKQPLWLAKVMQYHIQPLIKRLGINKRVAWHTFRHTFTSLLTANNENVKVVQELLRHASSKITMDTYAQARMQDKRRAQMRIAKDLHRKPGAKGEKNRKVVRKAGTRRRILRRIT